MWDLINAHESLINITTFGEYRRVMLKVMKVIKEVDNVELKQRQTKWKDSAKMRRKQCRKPKP